MALSLSDSPAALCLRVCRVCENIGGACVYACVPSEEGRFEIESAVWAVASAGGTCDGASA